jgi:hypothetical protein
MLAGATVSPLFTCPGFTLGIVCIGIMHCVDLGVAQAILGNIFSEYLDIRGLPSRKQKTKCESLWGMKLKDWYNERNPSSQIQTFGTHQVQYSLWFNSFLQAQRTNDTALDKKNGVKLAQQLTDW